MVRLGDGPAGSSMGGAEPGVEDAVAPRPDSSGAGYVPSAAPVGLGLVDRFDFAWAPGLVEPGFERAVETQDREPALAGPGVVGKSFPVSVSQRLTPVFIR